MQIRVSCRDIAVPKGLLNRPYVRPRLKHAGRERVPERMGGEGDPAPAPSPFDAFPQRPVGYGPACAERGREHPADVDTLWTPTLDSLGGFRMQRHGTFTSAFRDKRQPLPVDVGPLHQPGFGDPQPVVSHERRGRQRHRVCDAGENSPHLGDVEDSWQARLPSDAWQCRGRAVGAVADVDKPGVEGDKRGTHVVAGFGVRRPGLPERENVTVGGVVDLACAVGLHPPFGGEDTVDVRLLRARTPRAGFPPPPAEPVQLTAVSPPHRPLLSMGHARIFTGLVWACGPDTGMSGDVGGCPKVEPTGSHSCYFFFTHPVEDSSGRQAECLLDQCPPRVSDGGAPGFPVGDARLACADGRRELVLCEPGGFSGVAEPGADEGWRGDRGGHGQTFRGSVRP